MDDGSYITTHKIGYEESDRFRVGVDSCDSFLFLSPLTHSDIQVNGDSNKSNISFSLIKFIFFMKKNSFGKGKYFERFYIIF